ncbi:timeless protein [Teladorsagia circumcincta]|uniref:Timeless protein n=1 Tax=Teladorsagia circumcincta TaxID=45464 RepID=A0A2G9UCJ9_TELCI|nr:timeless protein [Teladorsagia circumcincta]
MEVLIQGTISALGYLEDGVYYQEPDCYETIRDLIRFLRTDNNLLLARKICGERNIIENDLIPIIKSENLKDNMFDITLRLLANLTQPAIASLQGKQPEDRDEWQTYWTLEENLRRAKLAFADVKFFTVLKSKLKKFFLETDWEDRQEEDRLVMERIVVLLRYIFTIPPTDRDGRRTAAESNSHDRVITAFLDSGIDKVLTNIAMQSKEQEFHLSIMVIFALILKEHVSVCLPVESFHHIQVHLDNYLESAAALAKEAKIFGLRAQHALSAYKELILFHQHLLDKGSPEEKDFAKRTCYHILTVEEYREMGFVLIRKFKLSLFRIFAEVKKHLNGLTLEEMKKHRLFELYTFGYHLLKHFFTSYEKNGAKLAPEILFWKGPKECYEIENGDGYEESKHQKDAYSWSEELENELRSLYNEYRDMDERPEGMDVLDFIEPNLSRPRTRKQILKKMKEFALDPLGAKVNKGSIMDRNFPIIRTKELIEQYNALPEKNDDMIDFLRTNLAETHGEFSRQKIIKQISYLGIVYEKKKPASKSYKWSEGLRTELSALKEQYSELDDEDRELIDLVDYCTRRLSDKKPKRQVKQELRALGAVLKPDRKRRPSASEPSRSLSPSGSEADEGRNSRSSSSNKRRMDRGHDEESDVDLELEDGLDQQEEDDRTTVSEENAKSMAEPAKGFDGEGDRDPGPNKELDFKEKDVDASPPASTPDHVRRIKRKRVISSSDEEDSAETADAEGNQEGEPAPESPLPISQAKRNRLIIDSDED